ncbi:hypothetical protein QCD79_33950, partial [Pseudomonas quasicaspiana]|nr:hypothetical protein [Pseudomonas quasicaspiana]
VAAHPTWGVDVGAAAAIHRALIALRDAGAAILVISEEFVEIFGNHQNRCACIAQGNQRAMNRCGGPHIDAPR